jgi:hypothetical protein
LTAWLEQHVKVIKNDVDGRNLLRKTISSYHEVNGGRPVFGYRVDRKADPGWHEEYFLMDRKPVFSYCIGSDRGMTIGGIALAIGPHAFAPSVFRDYEHSSRFTMESSMGAIERNLRLLDEFLGYR